MRIGRYQWFPVIAFEMEIRLAELLTAGQRCTLGLSPANDPLLLTERLPVPGLYGHVDPANHQV